MAVLRKQFNLQKYNTFGINVNCKYFLAFDDQKDVVPYLESNPLPTDQYLILGGGSNILFTKDYEGTIIHPGYRGIKVIGQKDDKVYIEAKAGENWDDFVAYCVNNNWGGIENLSLIPGTVGACPVQNIGAYGVEVKDVIDSVKGIDLLSNTIKTYSNEECKFNYRNSVFKEELGNRILITHVVFKLSFKSHQFVTHYGKLEEELEKYDALSLKSVRNAVIAIRKQKLPDPENIGNAGSFFKNPVIPEDKAIKLKQQYTEIPLYHQPDGSKKVSAAWLIDKCGWKGRTKGQAAVHDNQPLVLVNCKNATGNDILSLAQDIQKAVLDKYAIELEMEVKII